MASLLVAVLAIGGTFFAFVATVGLVRFPDVYTRAHAVSKSDTLGVGLVLAAAAVHDGSLGTTAKLAFLGVFMLVTNPTAAHVLTRSAKVSGVDHWTREGAERTAERTDIQSEQTDGSPGDPTGEGEP